MEKSIKSAIKLMPDEIIFGADEPLNHVVDAAIIQLCRKYNYGNYRVLKYHRDNSWGFQLANVVWHCYKTARYDKILSFDIDSELRPEVLLGKDIVGKNNVAVCSFTKKLLTKTPMDLQRYLFYRLRVKQSDYVFSGVYWVYRPFYFENIKEDEYKRLVNGVDTFMTNKIMENKTHEIVTRKEKGVNCMDVQNEDYPWRQFQTGVWIGANESVSLKGSVVDRPHSIKNWRTVTKKGVLKMSLWPIYKILKHYDAIPIVFVMLKSFMYAHPHLLSGFRWARKHPEHEVVKLAKELTFDEWGYRGGEILKKIGKKWARMEGTGFE